MTTHWYVQPIDDFTNALIANLLTEDGSISDSINQKLVVGDKEFLAYRISRKHLRILEASIKKNHQIRLKIYCQQGKDGQVQPWFKKKR